MNRISIRNMMIGLGVMLAGCFAGLRADQGDFYNWQSWAEELSLGFPFEEGPQLTETPNPNPQLFHNLRLTPDDCHNIAKLIKNMADLSLWELLKKSKDMKKLGRKIEPVHPLRFLGFIFSNPSLKKRMPKIQDSHFKWSKFMDGLGERLSKEARHHNLNQYIPGFCQVVGKSSHSIELYIQNHDWYGLLDYLM